MNLLSTLGLDSVEADPNKIPDGKYAGVIEDSTVVQHKAKGSGSDAPKDHLSHVITYKVTDGECAGKTKQEWYPICKITQFSEDGKTPAIVEGKPAIQATMPEQQKSWYKKRLMDLGVEESEISNLNVESLKSLPVTFGIRTKDGWSNLSFVELRTAPTEPSTASILGSL